ncbi:hypothetical protein SBRCBS47491_006139 [Sporothrix bragantina]|uniref:Mid2 domain-containing protein n=1 Tax=Sporothrix bragantina TaxID=671064 RepID=A0ABP0C2E9_9PEZI
MDATIPSQRSMRRLGISSLIVHLLVTASLPYLAAANANAPCYDPSGAVAPGYYPCDPTAYITNCCAEGWTCFSNSLCVVTQDSAAFPNLTTGAVERAMCTNPQWNNQICGDFCVTGDANTDGAMVACGDDHFCCLGDYNAGLCNCSLSSTNSGGSFVVNDGKAQTIVGETASFTGTVSYLTSQPTPSPTSTKSASTTSSVAASSSVASSSGSSASASGSSSPSPTPKKSTNTLALGLGVGLGVGIPLLAIAGFLYYWFGPRRSTRAGGGSGGRGGRISLPTDLALDGTAFGEQMAMQGNAYRRGETGVGSGAVDNGLGGQRLHINDIGEVPPPPPQTRSNLD